MESEKLEILESIFGRYYVSGEELLFKCPKCGHHKNKFSINIDKGVYKCWICDYSGLKLQSLVRRFGDRQHYAQWKELDNVVDINSFDFLFSEEKQEDVKQVVKLPESFFSLTKKQANTQYVKAINYLRGRGITEEDILKWRIGFCRFGDYSGRICVPSFDENGDVNYFIARTYEDRFPRYKNPPAGRDIIFNDLHIDWDEPIVLVEGVFDAIVAGNAIPLLGSTLREDTVLFQRIIDMSPTIYLALDDDAKKKQMKILKLLLQYDIKSYTIDTSGFDDVGTMTKDEFLKRQEQAALIDEATYLYQCLKF